MNFRKNARLFHRYIALIVSIQLLLWSISGLYFSLMPISEIHGDHLLTRGLGANWSEINSPLSINDLKKILFAEKIDVEDVVNIELITNEKQLYFKVRFNADRAESLYFDSITGERLAKISEEEILRLAEQLISNAGNPIDVLWLKKVGNHHEYRNKELPVYQINFDGDENLRLYLDGYTGEVKSLRTDNWRIFDFLWMLHVMDYKTRDNFNHMLLQFFALLAVLTSMSGIILWLVSRTKRKRFGH
ncbi:PepSY domain-containing protein [Aliikangiella maris]|uniref:PepSY domain-containing protein n=2 Tax=Aliikangiella maris TaxID=3162458 RepID=A0ABV2BVQ6_9GAMM